MFRPILVSRNKGKTDVRLLRSGELTLRLLRGFVEPLQGLFILTYVYSLFFLVLLGNPVNNGLIEVIAA